MSQGLCPSCGAAVNLNAGQSETKCQYCENVVTLHQAESQFNEFKNSKLGGTLLIADTAREGGSYKEALGYYNKIIEQEPTSAEAWLNKANCMVRTSKATDLKITAAVQCWKRAIQFAKNPDAMKKRTAKEIVETVPNLYEILDLPEDEEVYDRSFSVGFSALLYAQELDPQSEYAAKELFIFARMAIETINAEGSEECEKWRGHVKTSLEALRKLNPHCAKDLERESSVALGVPEKELPERQGAKRGTEPKGLFGRLKRLFE